MANRTWFQQGIWCRVELATGNTIPADLRSRLIEAVNLETDEALLTGESLPVAKSSQSTFDKDVSAGDQFDIAFSSSTVFKGLAKGVINATGINTEIGRIAAALKKQGSKIRPVKRKEDGSAGIYRYAQAWALTGGDAVGHFLGINTVLTITMAVGMKRMGKRNVIVRKLDSLEALGAVINICSDKTGTLTQGRMVAKAAWVAGRGTFSIGLCVQVWVEPAGPGRGNDDSESGEWKCLAEYPVLPRVIARCTPQTKSELMLELPWARQATTLLRPHLRSWSGDLVMGVGTHCNNSYSEECDLVFRARATTFVCLTWFALFLAWEMVNFQRSFFRLKPRGENHRWYHVFYQWWEDSRQNKSLFWAIVAGFATIFPTLYIPVINHAVFKHTGITWEWGIVIVESILCFAGCEACKWAKRVFSRRHAGKRRGVQDIEGEGHVPPHESMATTSKSKETYTSSGNAGQQVCQ
ncbi:hypothetical protein BDV95DRAFT_591271 [Massariosphaeria phaeospora]|uniref:P-type ATPase A domain-containing protein n=1 Tax=Massariosphaeria phaeospora TaxID=100035 RepID=A0A7C8MHU9_9PLEO|nr:hypothetical protein BDV95DRAFT_591271 [Massariosphaeria phaeospora]